ncbi:unnamed protein product [Peronospora farinosa]|uniref:RNase H type-1 domain-containing protein n=1 Tax=Peronospora farinosa TaxID=134698 RepID=A0AAV0TJC0_9STRA|nr:unnamed protein product [Peronospora farinosa]
MSITRKGRGVKKITLTTTIHRDVWSAIPTINDRDLADLAINDLDPTIDDRDLADLDRDLREQEQASDTTTINDESEGVDQHMAVLPEILSSSEEVTIDDIQVGDPGVPLTKDQEGLRQLIWANRHLLIGKGNALPPAARGAVCDIDVGGAHPIAVLTRFSTMAWLVQSSGLNGRLGRWSALLLTWTLEIKKCEKGEDEILDALAASVTPREEVDEVLIAIAPRKQPRQTLSMPPPTVEEDESLLVVSFDGSARTKRKGGSYSAIIWKLPEWTIVAAASEYATDLKVNEAEYRGLLLGFDLLENQTRGRVIICGDSNLVIRQMRGEIDCKAPGLQLLRQKAMEKLRSWPIHEFLHMKRDWNQSADRLASTALQKEQGVAINSEGVAKISLPLIEWMSCWSRSRPNRWLKLLRLPDQPGKDVNHPRFCKKNLCSKCEVNVYDKLKMRNVGSLT